MVTIFTPTYNRAHLLPNLYRSLCSLTSRDFEWLIIDDGSTDNTRVVVDNWIKDSNFTIRYFYQPNGGKFRAMNRGFEEAKGELFFIVDSDDTLVPTAIDSVLREFKAIEGDNTFAGVSGLKAFPDGTPTGGFLDKSYYDWYMYERVYNYDMAEVYKTEILRKYPFPDIAGEKFCAESLIWNRIGLKYRVRYFNEVIYYCEYLEGGLSDSFVKNKRRSPSYTTLLYKEQMNPKFNLKLRMKSAINYWRYWPFLTSKKLQGLPLFSYLFFPLGMIMKLRDDYSLMQK